MWTKLIDLTIDEAAFIEMVIEARRSVPHYDGVERMQALLDQPLRRAIDAASSIPN